MFKHVTTFLLFFLSGYALSAQNIDSLSVVQAKWQKTKISKHLVLRKYHFNEKNLFSANENISIVEVKNKGRKAIFALDAEKKELKNTSDFGKRNNALVAINGNFFDVKNGGSVDFVKVNGRVVNTVRLDKSGLRARHQQAAVVIIDGKLSIQKWDGSMDWETKLQAENILLNGPLLRFNGKDETLDTTSFTRLRHPRTCLGLKASGEVLLVTVDGRSDQSAGMSLHELNKLMYWLGCSSAINFDGGGSTTLWVSGFGENGIVNYPSDNKKWDHEGQRKVANVVLVKKNN
ncbi:phosphodiester glycosidase family protein [Pedobacter sp. MW01-1-1]|uniref:phosphodiester glycosidase family protein n=1 Tax=Pedobacter sp. MW01-1-1 TaxID=3383027 RepID=UPI003FEF1F72